MVNTKKYLRFFINYGHERGEMKANEQIRMMLFFTVIVLLRASTQATKDAMTFSTEIRYIMVKL